MTSTSSEKLLPVNALMEDITGKRLTPQAVWRWTKKGLRHRPPLRVVRIRNQPCTTRSALLEWLAIDAPKPTEDTYDGERSPEMERRLQAAGLL